MSDTLLLYQALQLLLEVLMVFEATFVFMQSLVAFANDGFKDFNGFSNNTFQLTTCICMRVFDKKKVCKKSLKCISFILCTV